MNVLGCMDNNAPAMVLLWRTTMDRRREAASPARPAPRSSTAILLDMASRVSLSARGALEDAGLRVVRRQSFDDVGRLLRHDVHSLVVVAVDEIKPTHLPGIAGVRQATDAPILIVSDTKELEMRAAAFDAGADEHVAPAAARIEVAARIRAKLRRQALAQMAPGSHLRIVKNS